MIYLLLVFQFALIYEMRRRLQGFNAPEVASWYLWISQIVYLNGDFFLAGSATGNWETFSYIHHPERLIFYYTCVVVMFSLSTFKVGRLNTSISELRQSMQVIMEKVVAFQPLMAGIITVLIVTQMAVLNWDIVLGNSTYLLLASFEATKVGKGAGTLIQSCVSYSSLISAMFLAISVNRRFSPTAMIWFVAFLWQVCFQIAGCSRSGAMFTAIFIIFDGLFAKRTRVVRTVALVVAAVWFYSAALAGRGFGEFGLTALPGILASPLYLEGQEWVNMVSSICQGAFITGDGLDYTANFNPIYKMLSFSPFPSAIDHFSSYLDLYQIRLSAFVPMGAQTEVIFFGPLYTALFWGTIFALCRSLVKNKAYLGIFYHFSSAFFMAIFMSSGAYPTRNVYRTFFLLLVIGLVMANRRRNMATKAAALRADALERAR